MATCVIDTRGKATREELLEVYSRIGVPMVSHSESGRYKAISLMILRPK